MPDAGVMYRIARPLLLSLDAERAHQLTLAALRVGARIGLLTPVRPQAEDAAVHLAGLRFPNRVGLAAGFDKNGTCVDALGALGFGFIEVGTVTPRPQPGNPPPRVWRSVKARAVINRMGFPNDGAQRVVERLAQRSYRGICGINIGKNAGTPLSHAVDDYVNGFRTVYSQADYVAINVSSPNTTDLRKLQESARLRPIMEAVLHERVRLERQSGRRVPVFVKLSPDLTDSEVADTARVLRALKVDGVIATNTSSRRPAGLESEFAAREGGLSGEPLHPMSVAVIARLRSVLGEGFPIIGVGGIVSVQAAASTFAAGADLIQNYTGLIYEGPALIAKLLALRPPDSERVAHHHARDA
ncbi:MAG TPA: quinone-dependent dihydroorotate dehydrogenase [Steroidobacteraceae bacterium]